MGFLKGQSATEQMITYGWAGMILIVVVGVLLYFGVFNFSNSIPERCVFQNGFFCKNSRIFAETNGNLTVKFGVVNNFPREVKITGVLCSAEPTNPAKGYPDRGLLDFSGCVLPQGMQNLNLTCYKKDGSIRASPGESYEGLIYIRYHETIGACTGSIDPLAGDHLKIANIGGKVN